MPSEITEFPSPIPVSAAAPTESIAAEHVLTVWEKSIDLQMHFNEMCMNLRRTAIGTLGALLAAGALAFRYGGAFQIYDRTITVAFVFVVVALLVWVAFYFMDRFWYHELLRAAVQYADELDGPAQKAGLNFRLNMSSRIREANHKALRLSGGAKINLFYLTVASALVVAAVLLYTGVVQLASHSVPERQIRESKNLLKMGKLPEGTKVGGPTRATVAPPP
jgi:hypothetical protein